MKEENQNNKNLEENSDSNELEQENSESINTLNEAKKDIKYKLRIKELEAEKLELLAKAENLRKHNQKEMKNNKKYSASSFITSFLNTYDLFESALNSSNVSDEIKNWLIGFEMINSQFKQILENEGVKMINTKVGDDFNSVKHFAIEDRKTEDMAPGKIVEIKKNGYMLHDRLLRPTTVVVSTKPNQKNKKEEVS